MNSRRKQHQKSGVIALQMTAIYVRQSAERADSVSLETQEQLCRQDTAPGEPVQVYSDRGCSGKNTDRPALQAMLRAVRAGEIGRVLVYKLDRISRNLADFTALLQLFQTHGIAFSSHTERFETATPLGQAMQALLMVFAQLERETICARVRDAAFARAKAGFDAGGRPPAGFRKVPAVLAGRHTQQLAPDARAPVIARGFLRYLQADCSLSVLAEEWNTSGFLTANAGAWSSAAAGRVLRNPVYAQADGAVYAYLAGKGAEPCVPEPLPARRGVLLYADRRYTRARFTDLRHCLAVCAPHEGIVPAEIWLRVQQKLDASRTKRTAGTGRKSWLSGLIFCAKCGSAITVTRGRSAAYLVCAGKKRGKCPGAGAVWRLEDAEALTEQAVLRLLEELRTADIPLRTERMRTDYSALMLRRAALIRALTDPAGGEIEALAAEIREIDRQCSAVQAQMQPEKPLPRRMPVLPDWERCGREQKHQIAARLLRCVTVQSTHLYIYAMGQQEAVSHLTTDAAL